MAIYDIDFSLMVRRLLPPKYRKVKWLAWLTTLTSSVQRVRDEFYVDYADGSAAPDWVTATPYAFGDKVKYTDRSIYECITVAGVTSSTPPTDDTVNWVKVQRVWIGVRERIKYNSQKLLLEYVLNKWFYTTYKQPTAWVASPVYYTPKSDIYITNNTLTNNVFRVALTEADSSFVPRLDSGVIDFVFNTYSFADSAFTINVPVAVWTALGPDSATRDGAIKAVADKYVIAGIRYNITTY